MIQTGQKIYIQKKVGDLLFFGYKDPLLDIADSLPKFIGVDIPFDKFGWFYKVNGWLALKNYFLILKILSFEVAF